MSHVTHYPNWSFVPTNLSLFDVLVSVLVLTQRQTLSLHTFMSPLGGHGPLNLCLGELTLLSPPELCLGLGHLTRATGERLLQPSSNPEESIDAGMAAGLSFTQEPQGELLISINVK